MDWRDQPAVPPVARPARLSQTLLRQTDRCRRAGYLYLKHQGGLPAHPLQRGEAVHLFGQRLMVELVTNGQRSLYAPGVAVNPRTGELQPEDPVAAAREVSTLTGVMVDEIRAENRHLAIPASEWDDVRKMAYHLAVGLDVDPGDVAGIERLFVLDLECGWTISGRIDLVSTPGPGVLQVDDYKSAWAVPTQADFDRRFQIPLYALLVAFGVPVARTRCECPLIDPAELRDEPGTVIEVCGRCGGKGYLEEREAPIGQHVEHVIGRELYPRFMRDDGTVQYRRRGGDYGVLTRAELQTFRGDVEALAVEISERLDSGLWPAVPGDHCSECPAEGECPLPRSLRRFAGSINTKAEAAEALMWAQRMGDRVAATRKEARRFVEANGPVLVGDREVVEIVVSEQTKLRARAGRSDWDGLEDAALRAANYGEDFRVQDWLRRTPRSEMKKRPLRDGEIIVGQAPNEEEHDERDGQGAVGGSGVDRSADGGRGEPGGGSRFGDDPPF